MTNSRPDLEALAGRLVEAAKAAGATDADAVAMGSTSLSVAWRLGRLEDLERAESVDLGLRAFVGRQTAIVSTTDPGAAAVDELVERAVAMAKVAPEDEFAGLADPANLAREWPDLELDEAGEADPQWLMDQAAAAEDAARAIEGVTNSEGANAGWSRSRIALATSDGFGGGYSGTSISVSCSVLAGEGTAMERDYDFDAARFVGDLTDPAGIGRRAGERAVARLGAEKGRTARVPVVYDRRVAASLLSPLVGAISGTAIARGTSFLKDALDTPVFDSAITVTENPHKPRGLRSKPFDGEGVANRRRAIVDGGRLTTWLLDCRSARQLGLETTGHAARGTASPPSPAATNLWIEPSQTSVAELIADIEEGFLVTELIGFGVNQVTGDYSRGASGFRIQKGEVTTPVSEVTIAGNLKSMYRAMTAADDLEFRTGADAPTLRIDGMTVAGR